MATSANSRIPMSEKLGFGFGELGNNLFWQFFMYFQLYFYTDIFKIAPGDRAAAVAGTMFLAIKVIDALFDVAVGVMADRTKSRWGKYRPYLLFGSIPFAISGILAFTTPDLAELPKLVYAYITYTFLMMMYSLVAIPQNSLLGVMTADNLERTILSKYKFLFGFSAGLIVQFFTPVLVKILGEGNQAKGYQLSVVVYAVIALIGFAVAFLVIRERVSPPADQKSDLKKDISDLSRNVPWLILSAVTLASVLHIAIRSGTFAYYFKYYVKDQTVDTLLFGTHHFAWETLMSGFFVLGTCVTMAGTAVVPTMTRLLGKRTLYCVLMLGSSVVCAAFYIVPADNVKTIFLLQVLGSITLGPTSAVLWPMYADCADYSEWRFNRRATGLVFSAAIMMQKLGWALAGFIPGILLTFFGYVADHQLTPETLRGLLMVNAAIPAVCGVLAAGLVLTYSLTDAKMKEIETDLKARREVGAR